MAYFLQIVPIEKLQNNFVRNAILPAEPIISRDFDRAELKASDFVTSNDDKAYFLASYDSIFNLETWKIGI